MMAIVTYADKEVEEKLNGVLALWWLEDGHIQRTYETSSWKGALMVVNAIGHLAEAAWHHPDLGVSYGSVTVKLMTHSARGITDMDFELAEKIEQFVHWQPAGEAGSLTGTPQSDRHRYIKYND